NGIPWLALLALAQQRGKATLLVNALYQEMSVGTDVLARLDAFFVRDPLSAAYVKRLGIECREAPDSIVAARFSEPPRITFDGGLVVTDWVKKRDGDVGAAMTALMADPSSEAPPSFYPLHSETARTAWDRACADIATAGAVISGRYHGLYLALLAGVPVVPMASNSWKVDAFVKAWGLPVGPCADARAARAALKGQETEFRDAAERMAAARTLPIFDVLGQGSEDTDETREVARLRSDVAGQPDALAADALTVAKRRLREAAMRVDLLSGKVPGRARGPFGRILRRLSG
ncbi:MAG: polysaccharide pyruvyl transferase family protein, partial [Pseudomonadota bacterium]